jgi:hypothetical protein
MDNNDYPREWRAAAAILGGDDFSKLLPKVRRKSVLHLHGDYFIEPPPPPPPPLPMWFQMRVCAMAWNDELGKLEDIDD